MNKPAAGIVTIVGAWFVIPIIIGVFLALSRLVEMLFQASFNWSWIFVISVGVGILGSIFVGTKLWPRLAGISAEISINKSNKHIWGIVALLFAAFFFWLLF
jgi:hypothetical protein